ncbi:hypothetical protein Slin15195_G070720 [Septoria linicola]|uniref:Uncharacterized protein n=1 Tax=Septoria linicola TaxID=215465 RepID=A0A9Q9AV37_9PEZI|nr:hypothetical protein Slin14017_G103480 [Septoria linicola]USW53753.1 hypothetical protein Slin15195_G070720 [Septoria linicola]
MFPTHRPALNPQPIRTTPCGTALWPIHRIRAETRVNPLALASYLQDLESEIAYWHDLFLHAENDAVQLRELLAREAWVSGETVRAWNNEVHTLGAEIGRLNGQIKALEQQITVQNEHVHYQESPGRALQVPAPTVESVTDYSGDRRSSSDSLHSRS